MTEQTIKSVREEAKRQEAERWKNKIRSLHNDLAFMGDTVDTHWVCDKLYDLLMDHKTETNKKGIRRWK